MIVALLSVLDELFVFPSGGFEVPILYLGAPNRFHWAGCRVAVNFGTIEDGELRCGVPGVNRNSCRLSRQHRIPVVIIYMVGHWSREHNQVGVSRIVENLIALPLVEIINELLFQLLRIISGRKCDERNALCREYRGLRLRCSSSRKE